MSARRSLGWLLRLSLIVVLAAIQSPPLAAGAPSTSSPERQILVMVKHPPDHYRPNGAYGGGYGDDLSRSARERSARKIARTFGLTVADTWPMPMIGLDCFVMNVPAGRSTSATADQVSQYAEVEWAQPVHLYQAQAQTASHNDPLYRAQPAARQWRLAELHRHATGRGTRIAIVDTAIDAAHPDLAGQVLVNRNFVTGQSRRGERHGTSVAGIISAKADNGLGIAGVAPAARILALRACWEPARGAGPAMCDSFSLIKAVYFAIEQKTDVINLSLSGPDDRLLRQLLTTALERGSAVVTAFDRTRTGGGFPASVPGVIAVSDQLASSRSHVYTAPGRDVPTTQPGGRWFLVNGSSFAAAHVSGLVALVRERQRSPRLRLVSERAGGGRIDACATLVRVARDCDCTCPPVRVATAAQRE